MNYLFLLLILLPGITFAQQKWELEKEEDGIKVYVRNVEGSSYKEAMVRMQCKGTLPQLKSILMNIEHYKKWVYNTEEAKVLKRINSNEVIYYTEFYIPWPASNRDLVAHVRFITDSIPSTYFIDSRSVQGYLPEVSGNVRINNSRTTWKIVQTSTGMLDIQYIIRVDPGGSIPAWLFNLTNVTGPYNSFVNLKAMLEKGS